MSYDESDCVEALRKAEEKLGHPPSHHEYVDLGLSPSSGTIKNIYGSWNQAKEAAGLGVNRHADSVTADYGYFESMSSQTAYWLGFIYGDGSLYPDGESMKFSLAIKEGDRRHLEKFHAAIDSEHKITESGGKCWIQIKNERFTSSLKSLGVGPNKTFSSSLPEIQEKYRRDFIRGLFDADGSIADYEWSITGSNKSRLDVLKSWIPVDARVYEYPNHELYQLKVSTKSHIRELVEWLYPDGDETEPKLERKYIAGYAENGARLENHD